MRHATLLVALAAGSAGAAELTAFEHRWLGAAMPVLQHAKQQRLPLDVVVQPQDAPGQSPVALGYVDGRCKLVLSMRGNADALAGVGHGVPAPLFDAVVETVAAHEVAHCWRHANGAWGAGLPAGFTPASSDGDDAERTRLRSEMQTTQREEAFADLAGLAWVARARPQQYADVLAWLREQRQTAALPGSHHDTLGWLTQVDDAAAFARSGADGMFEQALALWRRATPAPH